VWTPSFYGYDGSGTVRQLTNSAGAVTDTYEYDAFGNSITISGSTPNHFKYRGEEWDPDLGLYYLRARYMNPLTGRFVSRDPENGMDVDPQTLHKYVYADGDPVNGADPSGREDSFAYARLTFTISASPIEIRILQATALTIACSLVWEGSKTHAETVAGPFGSVTMVFPCVWMGTKPVAPPVVLPIPIAGTPASPRPPRCDDLRKEVKAAKSVAANLGACKDGMSTSQLESRYDAWTALGQRRAQYDNVCWNGGDIGHQKQQAQIWTTVGDCARLLANSQ